MSTTLARTAVRIATLVLTRDRTALHQCFRVKNLHSEEVIQFVNAWPVAAGRSGLEQVRLVVADSLGGAIATHHVAEVGRSITHYRNHNRDGLVYLETSVQSDEQGLQNMFSLRDSNFLDGSFDGYMPSGQQVPHLLIEEAWRGAGGQGSVPMLLVDHLLQVIRLVHPDIEPVPVRRFVAFVELACRDWAARDRAVDAQDADRIVGESLCAMEMFPDPAWNEGGVEARCRRRLELNLRHADLVDGSSELSAEDVATKADAARFVDGDGRVLPVQEAERWRALCRAYGLSPTSEIRRQIPYSVFSQLFVRDTAGLRLGDKVRTEIDREAPERLPELDALDVVAGLNGRSSHDATRLLDAVPQQGVRALADLLATATRKSVERLSSPPKRRFFNPAIEIVRVVQRVQAEMSGTRTARIRISLGPDVVAGNPAHGLFVFLFGGALRAVAEAIRGLPGACELELQEELIAPQVVPTLRDHDDEEDEEQQEIAWDPLQLRVEILDSKLKPVEVMDQIEWYPTEIEHFALWWLLFQAPESPWCDALGTLKVAHPPDGDDWRGPLVRRETSLATVQFDASAMKAGDSALLDEFIGLKRSLRDDLRSSGGLDVSLLRVFLEQWDELFWRARDALVPDGVRSRELEALLGSDLIAVEGSERRLMLALHPLRLRWVCDYLDATSELARAYLSGEMAFADGNGDYYLNWLESRTPRELPPVAVGYNGQLIYSRSEVAWCEDFAPELSDTGDLSFDGRALAAIAQRVVSYLDAHPYKRDGLSLLIVLPTSDTMPADLLQRIAVRTNRDLRVSLYVAAPRVRWEAIARNVERLSVDLEGAPRTRLFPDRDLALIDYQADGDLEDVLKDLQLDIAVVTHVLQEKIVSQQNTEAPVERPGAFRPLVQRPLRLETGGGGTAISLVMLPKQPDRALESWSTLAVRANRCRPVAPAQRENTDFIELRINFQDSARLFRELHEHCHWVVTLERHISREQIESVEAGAPDILSIEEGVGANGLGTLVVSSRAGRDLIQSRLIRKLERLIPSSRKADVSREVLTRLAGGIYDATRRLAPRLALQALGVARVTEEIVGLTVARRLAEARFPLEGVAGLSVWLSLDEHADWFGGHAQIRADMCRMTIWRDETDGLRVDVLVLEGKLRQLYDGHGVVQVRRTCEFFRSVLEPQQDDGPCKVDGAMWRELFASAIECLPPEASTLLAPADADAAARQRLPEDILSGFRAGDFRLGRVDGLYSACLWDSESDRLESFEDGDVSVMRSTRFHLLDLVRVNPGPTVADAYPADPQSSSQPSDEELRAAQVDTATPASPTDHQPLAEEMQTTAVPEHGALDKPHGFGDGGTPDVAQESVPDPQTTRKGLSERQLRRMYEDILQCFGGHGLQVQAAAPEDHPYVEGPASVLFKVRPAFGVDPRKLAEKAAVLKLVLELEQEQNVSFNIDRGFVTIDVPKRPEQRYFVDAADTWRRWRRPDESLCVPIGEDRFGELVELNFSSPNSPHLLVAGTTGSGKSEALNTILFGMVCHYTERELRLMLVDPKGTELVPFADSKYLEGEIGWDDADALQLLQRAVAEMQRRYGLFRVLSRRSIAEYNAAVQPVERLPWWVIVLDEYADLTHDPQAKKDIEAELKRLAQKARASGIHVIIATQKPSADVISTNLRSNLPAQLALRVKSATESRVVIDEAGAENLNGKGDALLKADGKLRRVQCSRVDPSVQPLALDGPAGSR